MATIDIQETQLDEAPREGIEEEWHYLTGGKARFFHDGSNQNITTLIFVSKQCAPIPRVGVAEDSGVVVRDDYN
jgi:hypothetical protein